MTETEVTFTITEVTVSAERKSTFIRLNIDGEKVKTPVTPEVRTHFFEQFWREKPTPHQKRRFATLMNLVRAAYRKGQRDAAKSSR